MSILVIILYAMLRSTANYSFYSFYLYIWPLSICLIIALFNIIWSLTKSKNIFINFYKIKKIHLSYLAVVLNMIAIIFAYHTDKFNRMYLYIDWLKSGMPKVEYQCQMLHMLTRESAKAILLKLYILTGPILLTIWHIVNLFFLANILFRHLKPGKSNSSDADAYALNAFKEPQITNWSRNIKKTFWCGLVLDIFLLPLILSFVYAMASFFYVYLIATLTIPAWWIIGFKYMTWSLKKLRGDYRKKYMLHSVLSLYVAHWPLLAGEIAGLAEVLSYW